MIQPASDGRVLPGGIAALGHRLLALTMALRPPDGWVAAGLLTINMVIVVWSVEVADWAPTPSLALVMVLAVLAALVLTRVPLWTVALLPVGLLIGAGVIIWQLTAAAADELLIGSSSELFSRLGDWLLAARTEGISVDPLPFATGLMIASWLSGFLAGWVFFRYRNFWGVFALGALGLMSYLTFLPEQASVYLGIYLFTGLLLVGWVQSVRARQRWDAEGRTYDGHLGILTISDTSAVAFVALLIAFLIPTGGQWSPANSFYNFTRSPLVHWEEDFNRLFAGLPARRPLPYRIWGDALAFQGTINPTDTPVLQVNSTVPLYWKARSYATYTHEGWLSEGTVLKEPGWQPEHSATSVQQERFNVTFEVIPRYDSRSLFAGGQAIGANRDVRIETFDSPRYVIDPHLGAATGDLPKTLRQAVDDVRSTVAADTFASEGDIAAAIPSNFVLESVERDDEGRVVNAVLAEIVPAEPDVLAVRAAGGNADAGEPYQLTTSVSSAEPDDLRSAGQDYAPWVWTRYAQLPGDMPPRVQRLARDITAGLDNPYDQAKAVESWLKTNLSYNLSIDPPPFGVDGVDHFLFESREGYSEYFGSAMTVLMRSLGVPARMTTGYTTGRLIDGGNLYLVSDHHSHGWSEVYFPGYGWIPFEPTPGKQIPIVIPPEEQARRAGLISGSADAEDLPCEIEEDCEELDAQLSADEVRPPEGVGARWQRAAQDALPWATGIGVAALLLAASGLAVWRLLLATPGDPLSAYRRLRRLGGLASLGLSAHQTPHQWGAILTGALPDQRASVRRIIDAYALHTYARRSTVDGTARRVYSDHTTEGGDDGDGIAEAWRSLRFPLMLHALRRREV